MTAKEKAKDLMVKMDITYYYKLGGKNSQSKGLPVSMRHEQIKGCVLVLVEEILQNNKFPCDNRMDLICDKEYWQEVKNELNKL
jgi:hypothetical protein